VSIVLVPPFQGSVIAHTPLPRAYALGCASLGPSGLCSSWLPTCAHRGCQNVGNFKWHFDAEWQTKPHSSVPRGLRGEKRSLVKL